jgi:hypothetical protein
MDIKEMVRFLILNAAIMKVTIFWDFAPCSLVEAYRRFRGACFLHRQGTRFREMVAASISETSVSFYQTVWRNNPEYSHLNMKLLF